MVFRFDLEAVEHLLYVHREGDLLFSKTKEDADETVFDVMLIQHVHSEMFSMNVTNCSLISDFPLKER